MILLLAACLPGDPPKSSAGILDVATVTTERSPRITTASVDCDVDTETWTFDVETDAWTAGGWVWLTDGDYVEKTRMPSVAAARDGSADQLELQLALKVDFRSSSGTVFSCASDPDGLLLVEDLDEAIADCRWFGADNTVWTDIGEGGCGVPL